MLPQTQGARPRILVADDDDLLSEVVATSLETHGYPVSRAPGGILSAEAAASFGLVILDVNIPGVDFALTLRLLRDRGVALLVLTGEPSPPSGVGIDEFLAKPVDLGQLLAAVRHLTSRATAA